MRILGEKSAFESYFGGNSVTRNRYNSQHEKMSEIRFLGIVRIWRSHARLDCCISRIHMLSVPITFRTTYKGCRMSLLLLSPRSTAPLPPTNHSFPAPPPCYRPPNHSSPAPLPRYRQPTNQPATSSHTRYCFNALASFTTSAPPADMNSCTNSSNSPSGRSPVIKAT